MTYDRLVGAALFDDLHDFLEQIATSKSKYAKEAGRWLGRLDAETWKNIEVNLEEIPDDEDDFSLKILPGGEPT